MIAALLAMMLLAEVQTAAPIAPPPAPIAPTSRWRLNTLGTCTISRDFDRPDDPITVGLRLWPGSVRSDIILVRKTGVARFTGATKVMLTLGPETAVSPNWYYYWADGSRVLSLARARSELAVVETAPSLTVAIDGEAPVTVALDGAKTALAQLDACKQRADNALGIAADEALKLKTPARPITSGWVKSDDYPASARRAGATGTSHLVLRINEQGKVDACTVIITSGDDALDDAACRLLMLRAQLAPARDQQDKPMVSHALQAIMWRLDE